MGAPPHADDEVIRRVARLARLSLSDEEVERLQPQFDRILAAFETLSGLEDPLPDAHSVLPSAGLLRSDREREPLAVDVSLANAPERFEDFYSVPKTLEPPPGAAPEPTESSGPPEPSGPAGSSDGHPDTREAERPR